MSLLLGVCLLQDGTWDPEKTWVFMVGILEWKEKEMYDSFPQKGRRDQELADLFKSKGVPGGRIVLLKDAEATKAGIEKAFAEFVPRPAPGDFLIVYYAGHGTKTDDGTGYFVPYDAGADTAKTCWAVSSLLDALGAGFRGDRVFLAADCCYSGTLAEEAGRRASKARIASLTSSRSSAVSTGNWTFTECLLAGLRGEPAVDLDGDGAVWLPELAAYAEAEMAFTEEQLTTYSSPPGFQLRLSTAGKKEHPRLGERLEAKDKEGKWYKARIVEEKADRVKVAYVGWDSSWDEWVGDDRLRPFSPKQFPKDAKVEVKWKGRWYAAAVLEGKLGLHYIHYDGYSGAWDEWVSPKRIRTEGEVTRYVRVAPNAKAPECAFTVRRGEKGWDIESVTGRGKSPLTVTARFDASNVLLEAQAFLGVGEERKTARVAVAEGKAAVTREGQEPQAFEVPAGVIVTSAPDWTDTFLLCRRYDRAKGGKQEFPGLWIHPLQPAQRLTFTVEKTGAAIVEQGGRKIELDRLAIRLRGGSAYVAWADSKGRLLRLVSLPYKEGTAELVLEGFEDATAVLKPE